MVAKQTGEKRLQRDISDRLALTCVSVTEKEDTKFRTNSTRVSEQLHPSSMKKENKRATRSHQFTPTSGNNLSALRDCMSHQSQRTKPISQVPNASTSALRPSCNIWSISAGEEMLLTILPTRAHHFRHHSEETWAWPRKVLVFLQDGSVGFLGGRILRNKSRIL